MIYGMPKRVERIIINSTPDSIPNQTNHEEYEITFYHAHGYGVTYVNVQQLKDLLYLLNEMKFDNIETICTLKTNETRLPDMKQIPVKLESFSDTLRLPPWGLVHRVNNMLLLQWDVETFIQIFPKQLSEKDRKLLGV